MWWVLGGLGAIWTILTGIVTWLFQKYIKKIEDNERRINQHEQYLGDLKSQQNRNNERDDEFRAFITDALKKQSEQYENLKTGQEAQRDMLANFLEKNSFLLDKLRKREMDL